SAKSVNVCRFVSLPICTAATELVPRRTAAFEYVVRPLMSTRSRLLSPAIVAITVRRTQVPRGTSPLVAYDFPPYCTKTAFAARFCRYTLRSGEPVPPITRKSGTLPQEAPSPPTHRRAEA